MDKTKLNGKLSYITKSDGSARFCLSQYAAEFHELMFCLVFHIYLCIHLDFKDDTCVIVAVYGPGEVKMAKEQADKACINVIYKPLSGVSGVNEKAMEFEIRSILEGIVLTHLHPRTLINVVIQNVQNDGNVSPISFRSSKNLSVQPYCFVLLLFDSCLCVHWMLVV